MINGPNKAGFSEETLLGRCTGSSYRAIMNAPSGTRTRTPPGLSAKISRGSGTGFQSQRVYQFHHGRACVSGWGRGTIGKVANRHPIVPLLFSGPPNQPCLGSQGATSRVVVVHHDLKSKPAAAYAPRPVRTTLPPPAAIRPSSFVTRVISGVLCLSR